MTLKLEKETTSTVVFTIDEFNYNNYVQQWDYDEEYIINDEIYNNQFELIHKIILIIEKLKNITIFVKIHGNEWSFFKKDYKNKSNELIYTFDFDDDIRYDENENKYLIILYKKY